jgi:chromosome segregation ATPase
MNNLVELAEAFDFAHEIRENPQVSEIIEGFKAEIDCLKKDNANLIEMNFNLEQQVSALKEDLEESNDECLNWSDENAELTRQLEELLAAMSQIKDIAENV